jgi:hypothetical protein
MTAQQCGGDGEQRKDYLERKRQKQRSRNRVVAREKLKKELTIERGELDRHCERAGLAKEESLLITRKIEFFRQEYPEFANAGLRDTIWHFFLLLVFPAVYGLNFLLIVQPVLYLAKQAFAPGSWQIKAAVAVLPIILLIFESGISAKLYFADRDDDLDGIVFWRRLAGLMVCVTPLMIIATFLARHSGLYWPPPAHEWVLLSTLVILAFATDSLIVFGGEMTNEALSFFCFGVQDRWSCCQLKRQKRIYAKNARKGEKILIAYSRSIKTHNENFGDRFRSEPLNQSTKRVMNEWMGKNLFPESNGDGGLERLG